jgi:hypothetical protein
MTERIEPALTAEEWASIQAGNGIPYMTRCSVVDDLRGLDDGDMPAAIAYANHLLPDSDPRKITRRWVERLERYAQELSDEADQSEDEETIEWAEAVSQMAEALDSYLPPEP